MPIQCKYCGTSNVGFKESDGYACVDCANKNIAESPAYRRLREIIAEASQTSDDTPFRVPDLRKYH